MRSHHVFSIFIALSLFIAALAFAQAQAPARAEEATAVVAYVVAEFDGEENLVSLMLEEEQGGLFHVVLDQRGRELGNVLDGEWVDVSGTVVEKDGESWMTVTSYSRAAQQEEEDQWIEEEEGEDWNDPLEQSDQDEETAEGWEEEETWEEDEAEDGWEDQDGASPESDEEPADDPDLF